VAANQWTDLIRSVGRRQECGLGQRFDRAARALYAAIMKTRLDQHLYASGLAESVNRAQRLIMAGQVRVGGRVVAKVGTLIEPTADVTVQPSRRYVSRGADKLAGALDAFAISPQGWTVADVGASTGGFTDLMLNRGAARVYAIDVGYGQLHWKLRNDPRVVVMERTNARYLEHLAEPVRLVTIDASFISLELLLPAARGWLAPEGEVIALIKPQFEAPERDVETGGVVRDQEAHRRVLLRVIHYAEEHAWSVLGLIRSPLRGPKGNVEFLIWLEPVDGKTSTLAEGMIEHVLEMGG